METPIPDFLKVCYTICCVNGNCAERFTTIFVLIINKPFKGAPFLAGFPGTIPLFFLYQLVREKPAI